MKHQMWKAGWIMGIVIAVVGSVAFAQAGTAPAKPTPPPHEELFWPDAWQAFHKPTDWFSMGLDFRFRTEYGENWQTLNDDTDINHEFEYQRYRTRWWTKSAINEDVSFNTRLTWETRTWDEPVNTFHSTLSTRRNRREWNSDEALFDWFNLSAKNLGGMPLTATIGRQDMIFGVGWLVMDGTPLDGSRTIYFDAARFTYDWADAKTKVDLVYVDQTAESDRWLEPIGDQDRAVTEQDEHGAIVYLTNTALKNTQVEGFFIYRNDNPIDEPVTNIAPSFMDTWSRKAEIYTLGGAVGGTVADHWKYRGEAAQQMGSKDDPSGEEQNLEGFGMLATLEYLFKDSHEHASHITYEFASGDDPDTDDNEEFDLLWGEWPRWSELLIYTATFETQPAALTNLRRLNIGHRFNLNKRWQVTLDYHALWADEEGQPIGSGPTRINVADDHKFRGCLFTSWWKYKFSEQLYGHLLGEYFMPGSYFASPSNDDAFFLRFNLEYIF